MKPASKLRIVNATRGTVIADRASIAGTSGERRTGLLKHSELLPGDGLWIAPCECIHTFGMKFPIDVVFIDKQMRVRRVYQNLAPYRLTTLVWSAQSVLELPSGSLAATETEIGDELQFSLCEEGSE